MERKSAWKSYSLADMEALHDLATRYIDFISDNKTERECVAASIRMAREVGYRSLEEVRESGEIPGPGTKIYASLYGKTIVLVQLGSLPLERGMNILGAHIDSPRLDIKQNPLFEAGDLAFMDTHYYGGIKAYQWVTIPLAMHGVVAKTDGSTVYVNIGDDPDDPVFCVTDLLPHLDRQQMQKTGDKIIEGEALDILCGSRPLVIAPEAAKDAAEGSIEQTAAKEPVRANIISILQSKYGLEEEDFLSAELEVVPAGRARSCGFDGSMVLGYGHDDRSCGFTSLLAQLEAPAELERTAVCLLVDKEEVGSVGATGMTSAFFENVITELLEMMGETSPSAVRRALANSYMLSSDVSAGFDPAYPSVFEQKNTAFMGRGMAFNKYTGVRGKSGSNDANAEYVAKLRRVMNDAGVQYQTAELGAVDAGGGGTIAYILAKYTMNVIDCGIPVLSMHSPWETVSKADVYEAKKGYDAFLLMRD